MWFVKLRPSTPQGCSMIKNRPLKVRPRKSRSNRTTFEIEISPSKAMTSYPSPASTSTASSLTADAGSIVTSAPESINIMTSEASFPLFGSRNATIATGAGGEKWRASYAGIGRIFDDLYLKVSRLFRMYQPRAADVRQRPGSARDHHINDGILGQLHARR